MRVLHINFTDTGGGAAIAAYRHHDAMLRAGIDSHMLVLIKKTESPYVYQNKVSPFTMFMKRVFGRIFSYTYQFYATWSWNHFGFDLSSHPEVNDADMIILHWINGYTLSIKSIERILHTGKRVYWFMHDMWPITGGCHHSLDCLKYQTHCRACPMSNNRKGSTIEHDLSWKQFEEKLKCVSPYLNLKFLTPSQWLAEKVKESALFGSHKVTVARNVLDTDIFKPVNPTAARERLGLPLDKKLILFGADNISSPYKGWSLLCQALSRPIDGAEAVVYGRAPADLQTQIGIRLHSMGHINEFETLIDLYSACDVLLAPSLADNYPNVLVEAMACGLPCVGTNVGGIPEIILNGITGLLTPSNDPDALRTAITLVLENTDEKFDRAVIRDTIIETNGYQNNLSKYL